MWQENTAEAGFYHATCLKIDRRAHLLVAITTSRKDRAQGSELPRK